MTINCLGNLVDLSQPKVMGILNITPNSFYDGGRFKDDKSILNQTEKMLSDGATFIDIGGYSSKPNSEFVSEEEEISRVIPIVNIILKHFPRTIISIDTYRSEVARLTLENGAALINDISAGSLDNKMYETIAKYRVPYIMMHMKGTPQIMQNLTNYDNIISEITYYFSEKIALARSLGISDIIIDPGFGFAKTVDQNFEILKKLDLFQCFELPLLVGISRKSTIYKTLDISSQEALNGTTVLNTFALSKGANIVRVHDIKEAVECVKLMGKLI